MTGKERYDRIPIPDRLDDVLQDAQKRAATRTRRFSGVSRLAVVAAACLMLLLVVNVPAVSHAMANIPVVGKIVQVLQFGGGGERTDGVAVDTAVVEENTLRIEFGSNGQASANVPSYTVEQKDAPNRLIFTFNGTREFDYDKVEQDLRGLSLVKDVYRNVILDDSAMRFVVELKNGVTHTITEFREPAGLELKLTQGTAEEPYVVYGLRSEEMPMGEGLAMLEELYGGEGVSFVKAGSGEFVAVIGEYRTREEAEKKLREVEEKAGVGVGESEFVVQSWMSDGKAVTDS